MKGLLRVLLLPLQAPMLLLLGAVSTYLGLHWSRPLLAGESELSEMAHLIWSAECLQALAVVLLCTLPEMLLAHLSLLMAASRFLTLVVALLVVTVGGLYLMNADELANVLILASAVLLARLDLVRIRAAPSPLVAAVSMALVVLGGVNLGRIIGSRLLPG
jgi:hypothetical protein